MKTISGIALYHAKNIAKMEFGESLIEVKHNTNRDTFDIYCRKPLDKNTKIKFSLFWNGIFRIIPINGCKTNTDIEKAWIDKIKSIEKRKLNPVISKWEDPFLFKPKKIKLNKNKINNDICEACDGMGYKCVDERDCLMCNGTGNIAK